MDAKVDPNPSGQEEPTTVEVTSLRFVELARGFWTGDTRKTAWLWTGMVVVLLFCNLAVAVGLNRWNRWFFDALERKDSASLGMSALVLVALVVAGAGFAVAMLKAKMTLQLRWRQWITDQVLARWLADQRYYKLAVADRTATSPEARITDDIKLATDPVVDLTVGFVNSVLSAVTFVGILFVVGGSLTIGGVTIPGYMAIAAVIYAVVVSATTFLVGRPLAAAVDARNESEAEFRFGLTRIRENVESIALIRGDDDELRRARKRFENIAERTRALIRNHCNLTWVLNANAFFAGTVALLLAVPKYLGGELTLGAMMQISSAFTAVLSALNWFAENYIAVAQWRASARRVAVLDAALDSLDFDGPEGEEGRLEITSGDGDSILLEKVSLSQPDGRIVIDEACITIAPGERVLLAGESGTGKSTLIRSVAGLWPWGSGRIALPSGADVSFVPQRPYIPLGTLRDALAYPDPASELSDEDAHRVLTDCGLGYMAGTLDDEAELERTLSGGERQRIAFARLLLQKPQVIVMDEATAALDVESESRLMSLLFERLPQSTVLSVGHRPALEELHTRKIVLYREPTGARIGQARRPSAKRIVADVLRRALKRPGGEPAEGEAKAGGKKAGGARQPEPAE